MLQTSVHDFLDRKSVAKLIKIREKSREITRMWTCFAVATFGAFLIIDTTSARKLYIHPKINPNCECGVSGDGVSNRIVGGVISTPHIFPWLAAIYFKNALHCGGALINDRYILTAGHCVKWSDWRYLTVGLGMHDLEDPNEGYIVPIDSATIHEDFESDYLHDTNDIALLRLKYPAKYSDTVNPVCLPVKGSDYTGHLVTVAGWGRVTTDGLSSRYLRKAKLRVMPWSACRNTSFGDHLTESMICAYADNTDACQGDSGGPLLYQRQNGRYETMGVVSWGIGCAQPSTPGIYVKNTDYTNWIKAHTQDGIYCQEA